MADKTLVTAHHAGLDADAVMPRSSLAYKDGWVEVGTAPQDPAFDTDPTEYDVAAHSIDEVKAHLAEHGDNEVLAASLAAQERFRGDQARSTLLSHLEAAAATD